MITVFLDFSLLSSTVFYCLLLSYCRDSKVLYCLTVETVILETAVPCLFPNNEQTNEQFTTSFLPLNPCMLLAFCRKDGM